MKAFPLKLIIVMASFIALDYMWLAVLFDSDRLTPLSPLIRIYGGNGGGVFPPSLILYGLLASSFLYFSWKVTDAQTLPNRILHSSMLGIGLFSVYECTNYINFPNLDIRFFVADVIWGAFLFAFGGIILALFEKFSESKEEVFSHLEHG